MRPPAPSTTVPVSDMVSSFSWLIQRPTRVRAPPPSSAARGPPLLLLNRRRNNRGRHDSEVGQRAQRTEGPAGDVTRCVRAAAHIVADYGDTGLRGFELPPESETGRIE